jgi:hypothetical protein
LAAAVPAVLPTPTPVLVAAALVDTMQQIRQLDLSMCTLLRWARAAQAPLAWLSEITAVALRYLGTRRPSVAAVEVLVSHPVLQLRLIREALAAAAAAQTPPAIRLALPELQDKVTRAVPGKALP